MRYKQVAVCSLVFEVWVINVFHGLSSVVKQTSSEDWKTRGSWETRVIASVAKTRPV